MPQPKKCVMDSCNRDVAWKGLCTGHYNEAKKLVDGGSTSWEQLEEMGLCDLSTGGSLTEAFLKKATEKGGPIASHRPKSG